MKNFNDVNKLRFFLKENINKSFPSEYIKYSYAYGSAVIPQKGNKGSMVDIFFVVNDLNKFHSANLKMNPSHYSKLAKFSGVDTLVKLNNFGTGVYYNPTIMMKEEVLIKYGVVGENSFKNLLTRWDNFFLSGRFHKPVLAIESDNSAEELILRNRQAAFALTLLGHNRTVQKIDFFIDLAKISYMGDIRTYTKAEKKDKIKNVVLGAFDQYMEIYSPLISKYTIKSNEENTFTFLHSQHTLSEMYHSLPSSFISNLKHYHKFYVTDEEFKSIFLNMNHNDRKVLIDSFLKNLNLKVSIYGILSGIFSTDVNKVVSDNKRVLTNKS